MNGLSLLFARSYLAASWFEIPASSSAAGKQWLLTYNHASHAVLLSMVGIVVVALLIKGQLSSPTPESAQRSWSQRLRAAASKHSIVLVLFTGYAVAMVQGTTWFYPEFPDLYSTISNSNLLGHFNLQERFIAETMERNSFRFFPLAHQDLHLLSFMTPYVKVWMLVSAAELFTTIVLSWHVVRSMVHHTTNASPSSNIQAPTKDGLLLLISLLFLFHPATGWGFFQLVYSERLLTFLFAGFIFFYWRFQEFGQRRDAYHCLICSLIGIYVKDIGVVLFVTPAIVTLLSTPRVNQANSRRFPLERWLCGLIPLVVVSYVILSLIPSLYAQTTPFDSHGRFSLEADWRFIALLLFSSIRGLNIARGRLQPSLIDGLNLAALGYAAALFVSVGYPFSSFWTLPVQLVTVMDLAIIWSRWIAPWLSRWLRPMASSALVIPALGAATCGALIGLEHQAGKSFSKRVTAIQSSQQQWVRTYDRIDQLTRQSKQRGETVNVIFMRSYFNANTLQHLKVDRLIEYDRKRLKYKVVEGIGRGQTYRPIKGDFLLIIDKREPSDLGQDGKNFKAIFRHGTSRRGGRIFRYL